jgi:signal transduction histidine kinase
VEEFMHRTGIRCELEQDGLSAGLSDATKTCVYRVVQEALHNCQKHAGATSVRVAMRQSDNQLEVEIRDDGRGFDQEARRQAQHPAGLGLLGMRERVEMLGGTLDISSAPGSGTRLSLRIPVEVAEPARTAEEVSV